jgi:hypothetical protein
MGLFESYIKDATFSPDRMYRYALRRSWSAGKTHIAYLLLNPSKANERDSDPTATRCAERARRLGYGGFYIINMFAYVATYPKDLITAGQTHDVVGPENNAHIINVLAKCTAVICGWGMRNPFKQREEELKEILRFAGLNKTHHLGLTTTGQPTHPLYIPYETQPIKWRV